MFSFEFQILILLFLMIHFSSYIMENDCIILTGNIVECAYQSFSPTDILDNPYL